MLGESDVPPDLRRTPAEDPMDSAPGDPRVFPAGDPVGPAQGAGPAFCPGCGQAYPGDALLCIRCGIDLHTGEQIARPAAPEGDAEEARAPWWAWFPAVCPGFFRAKTLVFAIFVLALAAGCLAMGLVFLVMGVFFTAVTAGALGVILYAQAVACILTGDIQLIHDALVDFDGTRWTAFFFALAVPFTVVLAFLMLHGKAPQ